MPEVELFTEYNKNFFLRVKSDYVLYDTASDLEPYVDNATLATAYYERIAIREKLILFPNEQEGKVNLIFYGRKDYAPEFELEARYFFEDLGREALASADQKATRRYDWVIARMLEELKTPNDRNMEATDEAYKFLHRTEEEESMYTKRALEKPHCCFGDYFEPLPAEEWFEARKSQQYIPQPGTERTDLSDGVTLDPDRQPKGRDAKLEESLQATKSQQNTPQPGTERTERRREKQFGGLKKGFFS